MRNAVSFRGPFGPRVIVAHLLGTDALGTAGALAIVAGVLGCSSPTTTARSLSPGGTGSDSGDNGTGASTAGQSSTNGVIIISSTTGGGSSATGGGQVNGDAGVADDAQADARCGDGLINRPEEKCDDGNTNPGDGCTAACNQIEANYTCPTPGRPCVSTVKCSDGRVTGTETCDDGKGSASGAPVGGDGCSADCHIEEGYTCPVPGAACRPICGDRLTRGREQCDDGNLAAGDGCDSCALEPGWVCPAGGACRRTVCGDGTVEGSEQCDDRNTHPFDGCSPDCMLEPKCGSATSPVGKCVSKCGDGILLASGDEECDDGNTQAGDGCDPSCHLEPGYKCTTRTQDPPPSVDIPIVLRDFKQFASWGGPGNTNPIGQPDFGQFCCNLQTGIVQTLLGVDRKPVYAGTDAAPIALTAGKTYFDQWYRDVDGVSQSGTNLRFDQKVHLVRGTSGAYSMNSATDAPWAALGGFFPLDGMGWGDENLGHNFGFTSELRYWFEYRGGEKLDFSGDDDVWVFVNGTLAVDLGGVHDRAYGTVLLDPTGHGQTCRDFNPNCTVNGSTDFAMQIGNIYEVVVLQAERHPGGSNYWITLTNFLAGKSTCAPVCGDGVVTPDEACDLGTANNTGAQGGCNRDCTLAPFCGDGHVDAGEACDDGVNTSLYGGCAPGCVLGPSCGDGQVQAPFEQCDDGVNSGDYGKCAAGCRYGPRCGDGIVQSDREQCDIGSPNGSGTCNGDCTLKRVH